MISVLFRVPHANRICGRLAAERSEAPGPNRWGTASLCPSHPTASHPTAGVKGHQVLIRKPQLGHIPLVAAFVIRPLGPPGIYTSYSSRVIPPCASAKEVACSGVHLLL